MQRLHKIRDMMEDFCAEQTHEDLRRVSLSITKDSDWTLSNTRKKKRKKKVQLFYAAHTPEVTGVKVTLYFSHHVTFATVLADDTGSGSVLGCF